MSNPPGPPGPSAVPPPGWQPPPPSWKAPPPAGWQPPPPGRMFWQSWSVRRRAIVAVAVGSVLLVGGYFGNQLLDRYFPDYTYTIDQCSAEGRAATMDFRITSKRSEAEGIRIYLKYRDQSGKQVGDDMVEVEEINPKQTVRLTQTTTLKAQTASITCEIDGVYRN